MNWIICANGRGEPYAFEASSIKGSIRSALGDLLKAKQDKNREKVLENLRLRNTKNLKAGLYLILGDEGDFPKLVGFWVVFGKTFLEEGPKGAPDKDPPYAQEILEALTEEVWWKNYEVHPYANKVWNPIIILHWPSSLANRSQLAPPGLGLSSNEFAQSADVDLAPHSWLERYDSPSPSLEKVSNAKEGRSSDEWAHLQPMRSLLLIIKAKMKHSRLAHKGEFHMIHPEHLGNPEEKTPIEFSQWLGAVVNQHEHAESSFDKHFLGQPLLLQNGNSAFPPSGWLTKNLEIWPISPKEIRHAKLMPRDVGSRAWAQFKQAVGISVAVLCCIVGLSIAVKVITQPKPISAESPPPPHPQPALSLCSADYDEFLEELRCQMAYMSLLGKEHDQMKVNGTVKKVYYCKDKKVEGLKGTEPDEDQVEKAKDIVKNINLQAVYCGLRDRRDDNYKYEPTLEKFSTDYASYALTKACYNVLGQPYEYNANVSITNKNTIVRPNPDKFFKGNLSIQQLIAVRDNLNDECDKFKGNIESQIHGSIFASFIGRSKPRNYQEDNPRSVDEGFRLREYLSDIVASTLSTKSEKNCFSFGMENNPYGIENHKELCLNKKNQDKSTEAEEDSVSEEPVQKQKSSSNGMTAWEKLNPDGKHTKNCTKRDSSQPRDIKSCSMLSQYEYARFGTYPQRITVKHNTPVLHQADTQPSSLWQCHNMLGYPQAIKTEKIKVKWDLYLPLPQNYNINGSGVQKQLQLDAGLIEVQENEETRSKLGACWDVLSKKLQKYKPVHPLIRNTDDTMWVSVEQQLCTQVCAGYYRFQNLDKEKNKTWLTQKNDLKSCIHYRDPKKSPSGENVLDKLTMPWNHNEAEMWIPPKEEHVCAFNLLAQSYFPNGIVGDIAPPAWAGIAKNKKGIAGGKEGAAYKAVDSLLRYGQTRGKSSCAYAATQCFAGIIVEVMDREALFSNWSDKVRSKVRSISFMGPEDVDKGYNPLTAKETLSQYLRRGEKDTRSPWCRLILPYLSLETLPEGQLDRPCALGVDTAQKSMFGALDEIVKTVGAQ